MRINLGFCNLYFESYNKFSGLKIGNKTKLGEIPVDFGFWRVYINK